ncbi:hypothetical protein ILUMI_16417 [Ignelater luminosus]|uniref:DDE Tnp4 domain-containing protein n=1 Tax=Ignelater luminosus TaxID=2038154 RepID=A0A8K0CR38_IGNLU|nr:hypothetical protein ILUMI_16417 [Ignelater luminosus]
MIDVGSYGKNSNGGILEHSQYGKLLYQNKLNLRERKHVNENIQDPLPFVFVGDKAFQLSEHLMKSYPRRDLDIQKRRYNYRLSSARQAVECIFGILAAKFRKFETSIGVFPEKVDKIILAACVLHNMIRVEECSYGEKQIQDSMKAGAFEPLQNVRRLNTNQSSRIARAVRKQFCNYFSGVGAVEWQDAGIQSNDCIE